ECIEKFFLGAILASKKLDVVNKQQIKRVVITFELVKGLALISLDDIRDVLVSMNIAHSCSGAVGQQGIAYGMDKMGFTQTYSPVQKQGVVRNARVVCNLQGGGSRQLISLASNKIVESQLGIQT